MTEDILTIEEVAKYLRVSERTVYDWAQKGEIPSGKIGTVWRFKKTEIERWVNDRLSLNKIAPDFSPVHVLSSFSPARIVFLDTPYKVDALWTLSENLGSAPQVKDSKILLEEIQRREELMSTAIGQGIAIPHVRLMSVSDLVLSVGIGRVDITDFSPLDDIPVRLIFMIAAAYNQHTYYLQTLSFFSSKLKNKNLRNSLIESANETEAYKILTNFV